MKTLKSEIKKAINNNTKYKVIKVWKPEFEENLAGEIIMRIEIDVSKKLTSK